MKISLPPKTKEACNSLIEESGCRMWLFKKGKIYLVVNHHEVLDHRDAKLAPIGKAPGIKEGTYYYSAYQKF